MTENKNHIIVPTSYLGNIAYYSAIASCDSYTIEVCDNYQKQTFRNRTQILGANGVIDLIIPIIKSHGTKIRVKDTKIENVTPWQTIHIRSIVSAYQSSPFFEHFIDRFMPIFEKRYDFLLDLNIELHNQVLKSLRLKSEFELTDEYIVDTEDSLDLRDKLSSKKRLLEFNAKPYYQVFSEKMPFCPNLSILDLLFCEGGF